MLVQNVKTNQIQILLMKNSFSKNDATIFLSLNINLLTVKRGSIKK